VSDFAGNVGTGSWSFGVDTAAPTLIVDTPVDGTATNVNEITIAGRTEAGASLTIQVQPVTVREDGSFSHVQPLVEGFNLITLTSTDLVGNSATVTITVILDVTAPSISNLLASTGTLTNKDTTILTGTLSEPATLTINDNEILVNADGTFSASVSLTEGDNTITLVATDPAGNSYTETLTIIRDTVAPSLSVDPLPSMITDPEQDYVWVNGSTDAEIVTINGAPVLVQNGQFNKKIDLSIGGNEIIVEATDDAGNVNRVSTSVSYSPRLIQVIRSWNTVILGALAVILLVIGLVLGYFFWGRKPKPPVEEKVPEAPPEEAPPKPEEEIPPEPEMEELEEEELPSEEEEEL